MSEKSLEQIKAEKEREMQAQMQIDLLLRKTLSDEAKARLNNIKLVKKDLYTQALQTILMLVQQGQVRERISDAELKIILQKLSGEKREINIRRK